MANLSITAGDVAVVKMIDGDTGPAAEAISAGQYVRFNTTNGKVELGKGTSVAECRPGGVACNTVTNANEPVTFMRRGVLDVGNALGDMDYDADVWLGDTDGTLANAADGTKDRKVGHVIPAWGYSTTADKLLRVEVETVTLT